MQKGSRVGLDGEHVRCGEGDGSSESDADAKHSKYLCTNNGGYAFHIIATKYIAALCIGCITK